MSIHFLPSASPDALIAGARKEGEANPRDRLQVVSEQFEALFLQQILKQMRKANEVLAGDSGTMRRQELGTLHDMHDQLLAESLSQKGQLGIADMLTRQLSGGRDLAADARALNAAGDPVALQDKQPVPAGTHPSAAFAQPIRLESKEDAS